MANYLGRVNIHVNPTVLLGFHTSTRHGTQEHRNGYTLRARGTVMDMDLSLGHCIVKFYYQEFGSKKDSDIGHRNIDKLFEKLLNQDKTSKLFQNGGLIMSWISWRAPISYNFISFFTAQMFWYYILSEINHIYPLSRHMSVLETWGASPCTI